MDTFELKLHLFDGDGAAAAAGDGGAGVGDSGVDAAPDAIVNPKRQKANPLANVQYGTGADSQGDASAQQPDTQPDDDWASVKEKYKDQYGKDVQAAIQQRFKNQADNQQQLDKLKPMLEALMKTRGIQDGSIDSLIASVMDDDSLYEEEAMQRGVSIDVLKQIKSLEADNERYRQQEQMSVEQQMFNQHIQRLAQQGEQLKAIYPGFDLRAELQNPAFARLTSPSSGVDVKTAYEVVHHDELQNATMQAAVQVSQRKVANAVRSGKNRPVEGGARSSAAIDIRNDPTRLSKADREEIRRRVAMGDHSITW